MEISVKERWYYFIYYFMSFKILESRLLSNVFARSLGNTNSLKTNLIVLFDLRELEVLVRPVPGGLLVLPLVQPGQLSMRSLKAIDHLINIPKINKSIFMIELQSSLLFKKANWVNH